MAYQKKIITNEINGDSYVYVKHPSGLDILIWKKEGFTTTEALFGTKYGSAYNKFKIDDEEQYTIVPNGIAHFLEHKLFENEDTDVFNLYAQTGAMANAYTSFFETVYLYNCSENYDKSLRILLSFVQKPYFTEESVAKEQGIIAQEIKMGLDNPERVSFFNLLEGLYRVNSVKYDIAGSVESISEITPELLYKCYNTFYNLNNMCLAIAGNLDVDEVLKICDEELIPSKELKLDVSFEIEHKDSGFEIDEELDFETPPEEIEETKKPKKSKKSVDEEDEDYEEESLENFFNFPPGEDFIIECIYAEGSVGIPIFNLGFRCEPYNGYELLKNEYVASILMQLVMGNTSKLYNDLTDEGLINSNFGFEVFWGAGSVFCLIISGESKDPDTVRDRIEMEIERLKEEGLDKEEFEIIKKSRYGSLVKSFDSVDTCAEYLLNAQFVGVEVFDMQKALQEVTFEEVTEGLTKYFDPTMSSISVVWNKRNKEGVGNA